MPEKVPGSNENTGAEGIEPKLSVLGKEAEDFSEAELLEALHKLAESNGEEFKEDYEENELDIIEKVAAEGWRYLGRLSGQNVDQKELIAGELRMEKGLIFKRDEELRKKDGL